MGLGIGMKTKEEDEDDHEPTPIQPPKYLSTLMSITGITVVIYIIYKITICGCG